MLWYALAYYAYYNIDRERMLGAIVIPSAHIRPTWA